MRGAEPARMERQRDAASRIARAALHPGYGEATARTPD